MWVFGKFEYDMIISIYNESSDRYAVLIVIWK